MNRSTRAYCIVLLALGTMFGCSGKVRQPVTLTSLEMLERYVGQTVSVEGSAENHKMSGYVITEFYGFGIPGFHWPHDVSSRRVTVVGRLELMHPPIDGPANDVEPSAHDMWYGPEAVPAYRLMDITWTLRE